VIAIVTEYMSLSVGPELNKPGEGSITLDLDSAFWEDPLPGGQPGTYLLDREHLWRCSQDGQVRFEFLGTNVEEQIVDPDRVRSVTISGAGTADVLRWAKVFPPGFPTPPPATGRVWPFLGKPIMRAYRSLIHTAQARGTIPWISLTFTASSDSGGVNWADLHTATKKRVEFNPEYGADMLTLLGICTGQDATKPAGVRADWVMKPGFKLDVRKTFGSHREKHVVFYEPVLERKERRRSREELENYVVVADVDFKFSPASSSSSIAQWGRRELWDNRNNLTNAKVRGKVARNLLEQNKLETSHWTLRVPYDEPGRAVFVDYDLGDWIGVVRHSASVTGSALEAYRVIGIVVNVPDTGDPVVELELQSKLDTRLRRLEIELTTIINDLNNVVIPKDPGDRIPPLTDRKTVICWDYTKNRWHACDVSDLDHTGPWPGSGGGGTGGIRVFIQPNDPGSEAHYGDFWYKITT